MFSVFLFSDDYLPNIGGVASHVHELARALANGGHFVTVIAHSSGRLLRPRDWKCRVKIENGVRVLRLTTLQLPRGVGLYYRWRNAIRSVCVESRERNLQRIYHVHGGSPWFVPDDAPRLFTNHTSLFLQAFSNPELLEKWRGQLAGYRQIIAPSRELVARTIDAGFDKSRVHYISNGVDTDRFRPDAGQREQVRHKLGLKSSDVAILCARRLVAKNGVIDFAHALRYVSTTECNVHILVAGNDEAHPDGYELEVLGAFQKSPLASRVRLLGAVPNVDIPPLYLASDIAVLPSLKEATSITGLEAMASGLPVVGTRVGGIPEIIDDGVNGLLVDAGDPRSLGAAINQLVSDPQLRRRFGEAARSKVVGSMTWDHVARQTVQVYERAHE